MYSPTLANVLNFIYEKTNPKKFVEIGGRLEYLVNVHPENAEIIYGVDYEPVMTVRNCPSNIKLFPVTADYMLHSPYMLAHIYGPDLVLISGYNKFEEILKIIFLIEQYCKPETILLIPGTWPTDPKTCFRPSYGKEDCQVGDNYKVLNVLAKHRPDLVIKNFNIDQGLLSITNLNKELVKSCLKNFIGITTEFIDTDFFKRETKFDTKFDLNNLGEKKHGIHIS